MSVGAVAKVCVGTMDWAKLDFIMEESGLVIGGAEGEVPEPWAVETGERVSARMERFRVWVLERMLRTSRGPARSRSWKPGKRRTPMFFGGSFVVAIFTVGVFFPRGMLVWWFGGGEG